MKTLVEFVAVAEEKVVDNFDSYMMEFQNFLVESGVIDNESVDSQFYSLTEVPFYVIDFHSEEFIWEIEIGFSTYENNYELMVSIQSDNYIICLENDYLDRLKIVVKNFIKTKHKTVFWLYDSESEFLATKL